MRDISSSEASLIGGLMIMVNERPISELFRYVSVLDESDFLVEICRMSFKQIKKSVLLERGFDVLTIDSGILADNPNSQHLITDIGNMELNASGYAAIDSHVKAIKNASITRKAIAIIDGLRDSLVNSDNALQAVGMAESAIESISARMHGESAGLTHIRELAQQWVQKADDEFAGKETEKGFTSGFNGIDEMLGDDLIKQGSLYIIGANPGKGKTAKMVTMSIAIAEQYKDRTVHVYSLEMPSEQITGRIMGSVTQNRKPKYYSDADWGLISDHLERLRQTNLYICDDSIMTIEKIKMNARTTISQGQRISAIFIDYLTLLQMPKAERRDLSVGEVSKQCKRLAKELGCVVVLLCQLSRANMQRANKRPINSDLRDSGQIEQDADYIDFPYYDYLFDEQSQCGAFAENIMSKNRHGAAYTTYAKVVNGVWMSCDQQEAKARLCQ